MIETPLAWVWSINLLKLRRENLFARYEMFFPRSILKQTRPTPESVCEVLSLPRIVYGQALLEWYEEIAKLTAEPPKYQHGHSRHTITDQKVLNCLKDGPLDTLSIAKKILGRMTWRRPISATLYRMASEGKIICHQEGDLHIWELVASVAPIVVPLGALVAMA